MANSYQYINQLAYGIEIVGAFLLAVEAIKVKNLAAVRENFFGRMKQLLTPRIKVPADASPEEIALLKERAELWIYVILTVIGFSVILTFSSVVAGSTHTLWLWIRALLPSVWWFAVIVGGLAFCVLAMFSTLIGFAIYSMILLPFKATFNSLKWIEDKTASGIIGILGFLLFLVGSIIHAVLSWNTP